MTDVKEVKNGENDQLKQDVLRRHRDEDIRDDDELVNDSIKDSRLPNTDDDEDDQNLADDDLNGLDIDTDDKDEWDSDKVSEKDVDHDDLDDENVEADELERDKGIGGIGYLKPSANNDPEPDEIPEEHGTGNEEVFYPEREELERANNNEVPLEHQIEVSQPNQPEAPVLPPAAIF